MIDFTSLKRNYDLFATEYEEAALRVMRSGWYILGPELEWFEQLFADYLGVKHCIGLNSGTDALILAVRALGIGVMAVGSADDEVIVPAGTSASGRKDDFPVAAYIAEHEVSLPIYAGMPEEDVDAVIRAVNGW